MKTLPKIKAFQPAGAPLGFHEIVELFECDALRIRTVTAVKSVVERAVRRGGGSIVRSVFHRFSPWGVSGVVVIQESHVAVHSWPEHGYVAVDIFSCTPALKRIQIARELKKAFAAKRMETQTLFRGGGRKGFPGTTA